MITARQFGQRSFSAAGAVTARLALPLSVAMLLVLYRHTLYELWAVWRSSATFAHGILVPPVCAWLIWRRRHHWHAIPCQPQLMMLLPLLLCGLVWLLGRMAAAPVLQEFALVGMLIFLALLWQGWPRARSQLFALCLLLLAVPFGEFLTPYLVSFTTGFIVDALGLIGIPVLQEHNLLTLPSGDWSVQEACSGLRYLIAMLAIASVYAHIALRSTRHRAMFMSVALLLPILGNGLRAVAIIMLGHYSDMRLAAGADHLLYGGLFFALLLSILLALGKRWRSDVQPEAIAIAAPSSLTSDAAPVRYTAVLAVALSLVIWPALAYVMEYVMEYEPAVARPQPAVAAPSPPAGWQLDIPSLASTTKETQQTRLQYRAAYTHPQAEVTLEVSMVERAAALLRPDAVAAGSGGHWQVLTTRQRSLRLPGTTLTLQESLQQQGRVSRLVWQWYRVGRANYDSLWAGRLAQVYSGWRQQPATNYQISLSSAYSAGEPAPDAPLQALLLAVYIPLTAGVDHAAN